MYLSINLSTRIDQTSSTTTYGSERINLKVNTGFRILLFFWNLDIELGKAGI